MAAEENALREAFDQECADLAGKPVRWLERLADGSEREVKRRLKVSKRESRCRLFVVDALGVAAGDYEKFVREGGLGTALLFDRKRHETVVTFNRAEFELARAAARQKTAAEVLGSKHAQRVFALMSVGFELPAKYHNVHPEAFSAADVADIERSLRLDFAGAVRDELRSALASFATAYVRGTDAALKAELSGVSSALFKYQTLQNPGCQDVGVPKDALECALEPFLDAVPIRYQQRTTRECRKGLRSRDAPVTLIEFETAPAVSVAGFKDFAAALAAHLEPEHVVPESKYAQDCARFVVQRRLVLEPAQKSIMFTLKDVRGAAGTGSTLSDAVELDGRALRLWAFVKFAGRKQGVDHYIAGVRETGQETWLELNDSRVTQHASLAAIMRRSYGRDQGRYVLALYGVDGKYEPNGDDVRGLPNLGNTCYMNAALQLLLRDNTFYLGVLPARWHIPSPEHEDDD